MKIDIHAHFFPKSYMAEIERLGSAAPGPRERTWLRILETKVKATPTMWSVDERLAEMDQVGMDVQVLSISTPNVYFEDDGISRTLAESTNEILASLCRAHPQRFKALASVPLTNVQYAIDELHRAIDVLGMHGVVLGGNILGKPLSSPEFLPFFEEVNKMGLAIFIHPMIPAGIEVLEEYDLAPTVGFLFDSTVAAAKLVYSGILERFPNLHVIIPHLGGVFPYIIGRIDASHRTRPECRLHISRPPSEYLKRLYIDTISYHPPAVRCALETVGADRMVLGSDYPFALGSMDKSIEGVKALGLPPGEEEKILGGNLLRILR